MSRQSDRTAEGLHRLFVHREGCAWSTAAGAAAGDKISEEAEERALEALRARSGAIECPGCLAELALFATFEHAHRAVPSVLRSASEERRVRRIRTRVLERLAGEVPVASAPAATREARGQVRGIQRYVDAIRRLWWGAGDAPARLRWTSALALAASLLLGGVLAVELLQHPPELGEPTVRDVVRGGVLHGLEPVGELSSAPQALRCEGDARAARYRFRILGVDQRLIFEAESTQPEVELAPGLLEPFVVYRWAVEALDAQGAVVARSERQEIEVRP